MSAPPSYASLFNAELEASAFSILPDELQTIVFSLLSIADLKEACLVCRDWYAIVMDPGTMEQALINDGSIDPGLGLGKIFETSLEWMRLREMNPFKGNLLENPNFAGNNKHPWVSRGDYILETSGAGGAKEFPVEAGCNESTKCITTSYMTFERKQSINLSKVPKMRQLFALYDVYVCWSVWIAPRFDCCSEYKSWLNGKEMSDVQLPAGIEWSHHEGRVEVNKKRGINIIEYKEQGKDRQFWAGHYGVKILSPTVRLKLQKKA